MDGLGEQRVQRHLAGILTGDLVDTIEGHALGKTEALDQLGNIDLPALALDLVADSAEQQGRPLVAGQLRIGSEGAVAHTGDNALSDAVGDEGHAPEISLDVGELVGGSSDVASAQHLGDDSRGLGTGQRALGVEAAIRVALNDLEGGQQFNSFCVLDLVLILEVSARKHAEAGHHRQAENEAQSLFQSSHCSKLLLKVVRAFGAPKILYKRWMARNSEACHPTVIPVVGKRGAPPARTENAALPSFYVSQFSTAGFFRQWIPGFCNATVTQPFICARSANICP